MDVREVLLEGSLLSGASGSWIVREYKVCGYVVAMSSMRNSCFVAIMERALNETEAVIGHGRKIKFGEELNDMMNTEREKQKPLDSGETISSTIIRQREHGPRRLGPGPATDQRSVTLAPGNEDTIVFVDTSTAQQDRLNTNVRIMYKTTSTLFLSMAV
ncbi:hypothetical protein MMC21_006903 [Puttea exsequens]|nr:hypothetical protein [Puttea exsequens]